MYIRKMQRKGSNALAPIFILLIFVIWLTGCEKKEAQPEPSPPVLPEEEFPRPEKPAAPSPTKEQGAELPKENLAPDFTLQDTEGKTVHLKDFAGKIIILNFWATWCPPCRNEIPDFIDLYKQYESQGVVIVGISLDRDGAKAVLPFMKEAGINYPILLGNKEVTEAYGGITGIPTTFIIDRKGIIREKYVGYRAKGVFENELKTLLAEE